MFILYILCFMCISFLLTYLYRHNKISDSTFMLMLGVGGGIGVYAGMLVLGVPYNKWGSTVVFAVSGILLGLQSARVIIRYRRIEKKNAQLRQGNSSESEQTGN